MNSQHESGADLFARLVSQRIDKTDKNSTQSDPKLTQLENVLMLNKSLNIDSTLFPDDLNNKDVVEIYGKIGVGKSELIMHLMAKCLLPKIWKINLERIDQNASLISQNLNSELNLSIDLSEYAFIDYEKLNEQNQTQKVILIETDAKFNMFRLYTILENRLGIILSKFYEKSTKTDIKEKLSSIKFQKLTQKFIRDCLKNLTVYQCHTSEQFILALSACELFIQSLLVNNSIQSVIIPIFIDSINSNFELFDKYNNSLGLCDYDHTEKYTVQLIKKLVDRYNVCIIASRIDYRFNLNDGSSTSCNSYRRWQTLLNKQIELINKNETEKRNDSTDEPSDEIRSVVKRNYLKLIEFSRGKRPESRNLELSKVIKENLNFSIDNSGFFVNDKQK